LYREANILILDEPTAVLSPQEVDSLFEKLTHLKKAQKTIVIITHKLKEILAFTDRVTVMRQGLAIETLKTAELTEELLAEKIIGRKRIPLDRIPTQKAPAPVLKVESLSYKNASGCSLNRVSFAVHPGEIVGIAGIEGNGQKELIEVLAQVQRNYTGRVTLNQNEVASLSPYDLKQKGFSLIPPDRHHEGVVLSFSLAENAILGHHKEHSLMAGMFLSQDKIQIRTESLIKAFDVRPGDPGLPLGSLSGGNQQKLVVARETLPMDGAHPLSFLLAAHPTRGIDIGAIDFIHQHFFKLKSQGTGILLISSELEEILTLSDRILVLYQGKIVAETPCREASERQLGLWMTRGAS
ncbi:MAG: ATP-binding cassette domain-containing protein, partial [Deltaproteobacteria bacterium]